MYYVKSTAGRKLIPDDRCILVLVTPCFLQTAGTAIIAFAAHSTRSFWGSRSCWTKASCSRNQVERDSRVFDGCLERAWTDSISVS